MNSVAWTLVCVLCILVTLRHENYKAIEEEIVGVTLNWAFRPTLSFVWCLECEDCGERWEKEGILPRKFEMMDFGDYYKKDEGWPHDPNTGQRLPVAK